MRSASDVPGGVLPTKSSRLILSWGDSLDNIWNDGAVIRAPMPPMARGAEWLARGGAAIAAAPPGCMPAMGTPLGNPPPPPDEEL